MAWDFRLYVSAPAYFHMGIAQTHHKQQPLSTMEAQAVCGFPGVLLTSAICTINQLMQCITEVYLYFQLDLPMHMNRDILIG